MTKKHTDDFQQRSAGAAIPVAVAPVAPAAPEIPVMTAEALKALATPVEAVVPEAVKIDPNHANLPFSNGDVGAVVAPSGRTPKEVFQHHSGAKVANW